MTNKPFKIIRDGAIKATIWKNNSDKGDFYSVDIVRGYKDQQEQWHDSTSFSGAELLRVSQLATKAYNVILEVRATAQPPPQDAPAPAQELEDEIPF